MAVVFTWTGETLERLREAPDLVAASRDLPQGSYTSLRTYGGDRVVRLAQHAARLTAGVSGPPLEAGTLRRALVAAFRVGGHPETRVRITWAPPCLFLATERFVPLPELLYEEGVSCATVTLRRDRPQLKDTRFIAPAAEAAARLPAGVHEGLMVAEDGTVLEGLSSNFFAVAGRTLRTEEERALPGITRSLVLEAASGVVPVERHGLRRGELPEASEAFLTSVSRGVLPVVRIDGRALGDGRPGPVTAEVSRRFASLVEREAERVG